MSLRKWLLWLMSLCLLGSVALPWHDGFITYGQVAVIIMFGAIIFWLGPGWRYFERQQERDAREFVDKEAAGIIDFLRADGHLPLTASKLEILIKVVEARLEFWARADAEAYGRMMVRLGSVFGEEDLRIAFSSGNLFLLLVEDRGRTILLLAAEVIGRLAVENQIDLDGVDPAVATLAQEYKRRHLLATHRPLYHYLNPYFFRG